MQDEVWRVVCETMRRFKGWEMDESHRAEVEKRCQIVEFDGGAFVIHGAEIDLFVVPGRRGKWATRRLLDDAIGGVIQRHGLATCSAHKDNEASLRLARRLGFTESRRDGEIVKLELKTWKQLAAS